MARTRKDASEDMRKKGLSKDKPTLKIQEYYFYNLGETTLQCLQDNGIISADYGAYGKKKPDQLVVSPTDRSIIAYIEYKQPKEFNSEAKRLKAFNEQIFAVKKIGCPLFIITDGTEAEWLNPFQSESGKDDSDRKNGKRVKIQDELGNPISRSFNPEEIKTKKNRSTEFKKLYNLLRNISREITPENNQLRAISKLDPTKLSKTVWQSIYAATGAKPEECLYTFVEMFVYKYLSDLGIIKGMNSFGYLRNLYEIDEPKAVLNYYLSNVRNHMIKLFPAGLDGTTIINGSVFHISTDGNGNLVTSNGDENTFKDIIEAFDKYEAEYGRFVDIDKDFKTKLFESFLKNDNDVRKKSGQFFTPLKVVQPIVEMADIHDGMYICDPACGVGKFLLETISSDINRFYQFRDDGTLESKIHLFGYEKEDTSGKDNRVIILAKANFLIYFAKFLAQYPDEKHCRSIANTFNEIFELKKGAGGTLEQLEEEKYDLILTNPPYLVNGIGKLRTNMSNSSEYIWNGLGLESLFMEWIVRSLKESGMAYVVVPDGLLSNMQNSTLRERIIESCYIRGIISLPLNTFFATSKKTYILIIQKKELNEMDGTYPKQSTKVFSYLCSSIGESLDVRRIDDPENNDLKTAARLFKLFRVDNYCEGLFSEKDKGDPRLKLLDIFDFNKKTWIPETYWTNDEKEALGIKEKTDTASVDEFCEMLNDLSNTISKIVSDLTIMEVS